ncbi:MAG TPA: BlaI/MecI/CopY family transcriptional regulator [Terriglobales bacterium]|nr:BlaI/MecI/CopY family transcriptional regulator [Terriglobales bacterium]
MDGDFELGPLERLVMDRVWRHGASTVRDVVARLERPLAYTTVMTTLDRLYKKGLLARSKAERAFVYRAEVSQQEFENQRAQSFFARYLAGPAHARAALLSCLLDAVEIYDADFLRSLSEQIQVKRRALAASSRRGAPGNKENQ